MGGLPGYQCCKDNYCLPLKVASIYIVGKSFSVKRALASVKGCFFWFHLWTCVRSVRLFMGLSCLFLFDFETLLEQIGAGFGTVMAVILWFGMPVFSRLFTSDSGVLESIALLIPVCLVPSLFNFHSSKALLPLISLWLPHLSSDIDLHW